jgi:hypothetical protein
MFCHGDGAHHHGRRHARSAICLPDDLCRYQENDLGRGLAAAGAD